jgi:hypothetical protein
MRLFVLLLFAWTGTAQLQCGTYAQTEQAMRICFELETQTRPFCVSKGEGPATEQRFAALATSADRSIVIEYAALANAAGMFGAQAQTCIDLWRRARCAIAFPLADQGKVCAATCQRLVDAKCDARFFHLDACVFPNTAGDCADVSTGAACAVAQQEAQPLPTPALPVPRRPSRSGTAQLLPAMGLLVSAMVWFI